MVSVFPLALVDTFQDLHGTIAEKRVFFAKPEDMPKEEGINVQKTIVYTILSI